MEWKDQIVAALRRLNPAEPPADDCYIARSGPASGPGWDLPERLEPLLLEGHRFRALMVGTVGVGKTTELTRWERLKPAGKKVVRLTVPAQFIGLRDQDLLGWIADSLWEAAGRPAVVGTCLEKLAVAGQDVLLLVDGLDLLPPEAARQAFGPATALADPHLPPVVYTAPIGMRALPANESRDARFEEVWHLPPLPVYDRKRKFDAGVMWSMVQSLRARAGDLVEEPLLGRIALKSGGVPRDAVRILRGTLMAAWAGGPITADHVEQGIRAARKDLEQGLSKDDLVVLWEVGKTGSFRGEPRLLTASAVLPYEDPSGYWLPHPLLWDALQETVSEWPP